MKKKLIFSIVMAFAFALSNVALAKQKKLKKHECTEACHSAGKCVKVHGEQGHKCDAACKK